MCLDLDAFKCRTTQLTVKAWQQALVSCIIGSAVSGVVVTLMARPGAQYHIGYPVLARYSMGMCGSFFFVFIRAVIGIIT